LEEALTAGLNGALTNAIDDAPHEVASRQTANLLTGFAP
jgi:hypothetical protein